ncbi:MAG: hypothetical protein ACRD1U_07240 [Vicinamibacterales bacterium]
MQDETPGIGSYVLAALLLLDAAVEWAQQRHAEAGRSALLAVAMAMVAGTAGNRGRLVSGVIAALICASIGWSMYGWIT